MSSQLWVALMKRNLDRRFYLLFLCTITILAFHLYVSFASEPPLTDSLLISISDETGFLALTENEKHPIELLVEEANQKFQNITEQQSRSLKDAVLEYRRRYRREPPPGFNHWYDAAVGSNTTVIDNFDTIMAAFEPYWAFSAQEIRARVQDLKDAQGWKVYIIKINNHTQEVSVSHTQDVWASYKYDITMDWIKTFIEFLPSMEIAFTSTDEPRNVVPREELDNAMSRCPDQHRRHVPRRPPVQFEDHAYRKHYEVSTVSCPPKHSSNISIPNPLSSNGLRFVRNITRAQDVCENPKVADLHGGFGPSYSIKILNSLHPLFSRAKLSSYQDLLFPAPDYVSGSYPKYNESQDMPWEQKDNRLYWAGSTTGAEVCKTSDRCSLFRHLPRADLSLETCYGTTALSSLSKPSCSVVSAPVHLQERNSDPRIAGIKGYRLAELAARTPSTRNEQQTSHGATIETKPETPWSMGTIQWHDEGTLAASRHLVHKHSAL